MGLHAHNAVARRRRALPKAAAFAGAALTLTVVYLAAGAPTPILLSLQTRWAFSSAILTVAFASYALALLLALLTVGGLSDFIGRRPVVVGSLVLLAVSMFLFVFAPSIAWVIAARVIQGLATGAVSSALTAAVVEQAPDHQKRIATAIVSGASAAGLGLGALLSGITVQFSAAPVPLVFGTLGGLAVVGAITIAISPETVSPRAGAVRSLRPHVFVASRARVEFRRALPGFIASWMFAALFLGLVPTIIFSVFHIDSGLVNGLTAFVEPASAAIAGFALERLSARPMNLIGTAGVALGAILILASLAFGAFPLLIVGGIVGGFGFGAVFSGTLRGLTPLVAPRERAELFSAIFVVAYLAFGIPAIVVGQLAGPLGLEVTVVGFVVLTFGFASAGTLIYTFAPSRARSTLSERNSARSEEIPQKNGRTMSSLTLRYDGDLAIIEIANPPHNRFTEEMRRQFDDIITSVETGPARALLIKGNSEVFSHGLDIAAWPEYDGTQLRETLSRFLNTFNRFEQLQIPTVAAVTGTCTGGAYELILRADIVVAASSARFGSTEETLGLVTGFGGVIRTAERAGRAFAIDAAFNSSVFSADVAAARGIISRSVPDAELDDVVAELTTHLVHGPTAAYKANKAMLRHAASAGVAATEEIIIDLSMPAVGSRDAHRAIVSAVTALASGQPRPALKFEGH